MVQKSKNILKILIGMLIISLLLTSCSNKESQLLEQIENLENQLHIENETADTRLQDLESKYKEKEDDLIEANKRIEVLKEQIDALGENSIHKNPEFFISSYHDGMIGVGFKTNEITTYQEVKIVGYGHFDREKHDIINISPDANPSLRIEISGALYNFKIQRILWANDIKTFDVKETICHYDKIDNTDLLFSSLLAEGLPAELMSWEDEEGKSFYYMIADTGLSGNVYPYVIISEIANLEPWWEE